MLNLPWAEGDAERAAVVCFDDWRDARSGEGPGELVAAMAATRAATEHYGERRFRNLDLVHSTEPAALIQQVAIGDQLG
jgi:putative DNA primase/helicase